MSPDDITSLMSAVPMPLVLIGRNERVIAGNEAAGVLFGRAMQGRHYITVLRQPPVLDAVERALKTGVPVDATLLTREATRDSTYKVRAAPVSAKALEGLDGVLLSFEDISQLQAATQMRRDFVANVSHELRTPLTAMMGFIETLRGPAKDDKPAQQRFLEIMQREANRMNRLIHDLLSLSRVESEQRMRPTGQVDLASLVTSARLTLGPLAQENNAVITVNGADEPIQVPGDSDQLLQVFTNLIENAIKYGGGAVQVDLTLTERDPSLRSAAVRVVVHDNGAGIDPLHIPRLTERFYRIDNHRSREMGGTGLGLAIVKHIINRHRGRLRIESEAGAGSRFIVILPRG